jgi:PAS domain-containing protein
MASTLPSPNEVLSPEQSLARERAILQYVVDNVPYCIFWKDKESRYLGCNKNFAALDGCSDPRELVGKTDYDMAWREHAEGYRRFDRATMDAEPGGGHPRRQGPGDGDPDQQSSTPERVG